MCSPEHCAYVTVANTQFLKRNMLDIVDDELGSQAGRKKSKTVKAKKEYVPNLGTANWVFLLMLVKVHSLKSGACKVAIAPAMASQQRRDINCPIGMQSGQLFTGMLQ